MNTPRPPLLWEEKDDAVSQCAADFFERRHFGAWNEADQAELDAWITESYLHRAAWLRVKGVVAYTEHLAAVHTFKVDTKAGKAALPGKFLRRRFVIPLLAAASIALVAAAGIPFVNALLQPPDRTYATDVGGRALLNFADRTQVELNTDTILRFRMTSRERTVWLEKGEAWFHVAHDATHPFNVIVGKHRVTDLGTEFVVRRGVDGVEVALLNGRAALSADGAPSTVLRPGDDAVATLVSMTVTRKTAAQLADALSWRRGVLVFRNTKLAEAVREFNRYNQTKLVIADPSIADVKVTAELQTDHFDEFLQFAQSVLGLHVDHEGNDVLISRGSRDGMKRAARIKRDE